jgi:hypothetical protein
MIKHQCPRCRLKYSCNGCITPEYWVLCSDQCIMAYKPDRDRKH